MYIKFIYILQFVRESFAALFMLLVSFSITHNHENIVYFQTSIPRKHAEKPRLL